MLLLAASCATRPPAVKTPGEPAFYPPPPAPPRLQLLASLSGESDLGRPLSPWARFLLGAPSAKDPVEKPYGAALRSDRIFVCDTVARCVCIFDLDRKTLAHWRPRGDGRFDTPVNIAADADGSLYVADPGRGRVLVFDGERRYLGALAAEDGMRPTDVAVSGDRVYVADLQARSIRVYDKASRTPLFGIPRDDAEPDAALFSPVNLALDAERHVYVSDIGAFRVQRYDTDGRFVRSYGGPGDTPGRFARPKGVAVDREGRVYVVDAAAQVVQVFDPQGELLLFFGDGGPDKALSLPADVVIDYEHVGRFASAAASGFIVEHLVLVSSQYGSRKVNVYGFGHSQ